MTDEADRRNLLLLVVVGLIWGSAYPVIRYGLLDGASPILFAAARYALSAVAIAVLAAATGVARPKARALGLSALLGVPIVGVYGLLLYVGEQSTSGGLAAILIAVTPLLTALITLALLPGESLGRFGYVGLSVGFLGVVLLVFPPPGVVLASSIWGPVAVFGAALSFAIGSVLLRRTRPTGETLWGISVQFAVATLLLTAVLPILEPHPSLPTNTGGLLALAYLVLLPSLVGYALYFYLHHQVGPGRANVVAYVNPVAAISIGTLLFGEPFQLYELAGFALVIAGLTILTRFGRPKPPMATEEPSTDPAAPTTASSRDTS
ncbi:MAG: EamA family transporter [Thermoplasmata archaeon]|nr:EamA family transporter [Thermoplasmata archaeon]